MKVFGLALCLFVPVAGCSTDDPSSSPVSDVAPASVDTVAGEVQGGADAVAPGGEDSGSADSVLADISMALDALDALGDGVGDGTPGQADTGALSGCAYPLVVLQTGKDTECSGGNHHQWPVGMAQGDCHGWSAVDTSGSGHDNSANTIACNEDGSFSFTQYAGNLTCSGSGTVKTFFPDVCQQDIPPVLHTKAINLACCADLDHPDCVVAVPSVSIPGGTVTLNGEACP